ncbi:MAG: response regulator [Gemmatimonadota bacterium]
MVPAEPLEIVLIDDEPTIVGVLTRVLATRAGFEPRGFTESAAALHWLGEHTPALVITDHLMPGPSGLDVARALRLQPTTRDVPILMLTGNAAPALEEEARRVGINRLAHKPLRIDELLGHIDELLQSSHQLRLF